MVDTAEEAVAFILSHPMVPKNGLPRTFGFSHLLLSKGRKAV